MNANKYPGVLFLAFAFALGWILMAWTTVFGVSGNTAHASGQTWAGSIIFLVVSIYGGVAMADAIAFRKL